MNFPGGQKPQSLSCQSLLLVTTSINTHERKQQRSEKCLKLPPPVSNSYFQADQPQSCVLPGPSNIPIVETPTVDKNPRTVTSLCVSKMCDTMGNDSLRSLHGSCLFLVASHNRMQEWGRRKFCVAQQLMKKGCCTETALFV